MEKVPKAEMCHTFKKDGKLKNFRKLTFILYITKRTAVGDCPYNLKKVKTEYLSKKIYSFSFM